MWFYGIAILTLAAALASGQQATIVINTTSLPNGTLGVPYSQQLSATASVTSCGEGGDASITWYQSSEGGPGLPAGLDLSSDGRITGTPTEMGSFSFMVGAFQSCTEAYAYRTLTLTIDSPISITTSTLPQGVVGTPYAVTLKSAGAEAGDVLTWKLFLGTLPPGIALSPEGVLSGTPTTSGSYYMLIQLLDTQPSGQTVSASRSLTLVVVASPLAITNASSLSPGLIGESYSQQMAATGGVPPYTWSVSSGALPPGVTLNSSTGLISGTPTAAGNFGFQLAVGDKAAGKASGAFTIVVAGKLAISTSSPLPAGELGAAYSTTLSATGGAAPYTWSIAGGALPAGITLDPATGLLSGTPTAGGEFNVTIGVKDASQTASSAFRLTINVPPPPIPSITGLPDAPSPASQPTMGISVSSAYALDLTGHATLTFAPDGASDDPAVQFTTGGRSADFRIPAGSTQAVFGISALGVQTGTIAGTITITLQVFAAGVDVTPTPPPTRVLRIAGTPPVITSAKLVANSTGFNLVVIGYATTREVTGATVHLTPAADARLTTSDFSIQLTSVFAAWYQDAASILYGSQFSLTIPFAVENVANVVASLTVTLTNSQGTSAAATATF
jgi:hypothetical protein